MPVYIHLSNLVFTKSDIEQHYKGGLEAFRDRFFWKDCNNQEDNEIFAIAAMNPDELPVDELKENGMEPVFASENYDVVHRYGAKSNVEWLEIKQPFMWHIDCSQKQKDKAIDVTKMTMDKIMEESEKGNNLFNVIK